MGPVAAGSDLALNLALTTATTSSGLISSNGHDITFSRSSTAYRRNSSGLLESVASNIARLDHDSAGNPLGLLIEEARTNLLTRSEELDHTDWGKLEVTISADAATAPDGETTADLLTEAATVNQHHVDQGITAAAGNLAFTVWAENASGSRYLNLRPRGVGTGKATAAFNLVNGTVFASGGTELVDASIEDYGNGRYRCVLVGNYASAPAGMRICLSDDGTENPSYTGDGSSGIYIWGAQIEAGSFPTSYVKTTTASATRAASSDHILTANISGFNNAKGTLYVEGRTALGSGTQVLAQFDDDTENERIRIERNSSNEIHAIVTDGGTGQADLNLGTVADDTAFKVALSWQAGDFKGCLDGATVQTDAAGTIPTVDRLRLGLDSADDHWNGTIKTVQVYSAIRDTQGLTT